MSTVIQLNDLHPGTASMDAIQPPASSTYPAFPENDHRIPIYSSHYANLIPTVGPNRIFGKLLKEDGQLSPPSPSQLDTSSRVNWTIVGGSAY